jgi:Protein of unknown function (DUF3455)
MAFSIVPALSAQAGSVNPPAVPFELRVEPPHEAFLVGHAIGSQNYVCLPSPSIGQVAWTLFTPQATLFGDEQEQITTHFFGPVTPGDTVVRAAWQDSRDTSTIWGRATAFSFDSAFVRPGAVPWVLLERAGSRVGPTGGDTLSRTTFIQRVNTAGGAAPPTGCDRPTDIGRSAFVPYTADYFFYRNPGAPS